MARVFPLLNYSLGSLLICMTLPLIISFLAIIKGLIALSVLVLYHPVCTTVSIIPCRAQGQSFPLSAAIVCTENSQKNSPPNHFCFQDFVTAFARAVCFQCELAAIAVDRHIYMNYEVTVNATKKWYTPPNFLIFD